MKNDGSVNFKPADFTPYETKIRMAVLVNLLNSIIPSKVTPTRNATNTNDTLFNTAAGPIAKSLKEFIYFENGQYKVNTGSTGTMPSYMGGWDGGIKTPGMTFWKYGVHSTTFQITIDAFKYDDSTRLSSVVTFDSYTNAFTSPVDITQNHKDTKYALTPAAKAQIHSSIYLNPLGRADALANDFVIGNGEMRYPTDKNTDSWRILSFVWSSTYARTGSKIDEYFVPVMLFPGDVVNKGPDGGSWHFVPHPAEPAPFTKFFMDAAGDSQLTFFGPWGNASDYSTGSMVPRDRCFGNGSWIKWKATFTKSMGANQINVMLSRNGANANSGYTQTHSILITNRATGFSLPVLNFSTKSDWSYQVNYIQTIAVPVDAGEYDVKLTEKKDSNTGNYGNEQVFKVTIYAK
jgi:hypothetical protein